MPTYAYACKDCGHQLEVFQSFTDDALTTCPECGGNLRKVFNSVGVVFKGSGFYRTDSRDSSSKSSSSSSTTASTTSTSDKASSDKGASTSSSTSSTSSDKGSSSTSTSSTSTAGGSAA